ncbi:MAG: TRAP transporter small permease [Bacillota bacterium]
MKDIWLKSYAVFGKVKLLGLILCGIGLFCMMGFIVLEVAMRNLFNSSIPGNYEIVQNYFMPVVTLPIVVYAFSEGVLPRINMLVAKFHNKVQKGILLSLLLIEIVIFVLMTFYGWQYAISGMEAGDAFPASGSMYPIYPFYFLIPIGFGMLLIEMIFLFGKNLMDKDVSFTVSENKNEELYVS